MAKDFTPEARAKALATMEEKVKKRRESAMQFGDRIIRQVDDLNWGIEEPGKDLKYYARFEHAVESMLHMKIEDKVRGDLQQILSAIKSAESEVAQVIQKFRVFT